MTNQFKPQTGFAQYGIAVFRNIGDILLCTPIARQLKDSDPGCFVTWYTSERYAFVLDGNPYIDQIIALPADDPVLLDSLLPSLQAERAWTRFFAPAPYLNYHASIPTIVQSGITLLDLVRDAAALKWSVPFMPVMKLTEDEVDAARAYRDSLPKDGPLVLVESEFNSNQTDWGVELALQMVNALKGLNPVLVFSAKNRPEYLDLLLEVYPRIYWCNVAFRLNAELFNLCNGFIGVSSGISTLSYATWCKDNVPRIEVSRGPHWSGFQHLKTRLLQVCHTADHFADALNSFVLQLNRHKPIVDQVKPSPLGRNAPEVVNRYVSVSFDISVLGVAQAHERARTGVYRVVDNLLKKLMRRADVQMSLVTHPSVMGATQEFVKSRSDLAQMDEVRSLTATPAGQLLHSPFFPLPVPSNSGPRVLTVHDLIPIKFPHLFEFGEDSSIRNTIASLSPDDFVTAVSESTKADLCAYAPHIHPERVVVTTLAADSSVFFPCKDFQERQRIFSKYKLDFRAQYLLSVATLEPRKNIAHLIGAFVRLLKEHKPDDLILVLVGAKGWKFEAIFDELALAGDIRQRITLTGFVPDEDMAALYSNAMAFAYPSLYEGFGLPPLEAMQCGTPVITSDNSSLPEVVGDAGIMVPAQDEAALVDAIWRLYSDKTLRQQLSQKGLARAATFTWERCVDQTVATYRMAYAHWASKQTETTSSPKTIVVDAVFFQLYQTGIARVWRSLLQEWALTEFSKRLVVLDRAGTAPRFEGIKYIPVPRYDYSDTNSDRAMLQRVCDAENAAVFISSYYTTPVTTPSIFMAHDMIPELLGADVVNTPMWREKHFGVRHAKHFIAVSNNTAKDLRRFFPNITSDQLTVAHNGVNFKPQGMDAVAAFRAARAIYRPYFLLVGGRDGYKNTALFFKAFAALGAARSRYAIVCTGPVLELEPQHAGMIGGAMVHMLNLSDAELQCAYSGAQALIYPSLYEGFGMPILEAMACGCPVVTTRKGSIPEVAGDAALYVDGADVGEMTRALKHVQKAPVRKRFVELGLKRAAGFSWRRMANQVQAVLENIAAQPFGGDSQGDVKDAFAHHQAGRLDAAEVQYRQVLRRAPNDFVALHMLGVLLNQKGDHLAAEQLLLRALAINQLTPHAHHNLGNIYLAQGRIVQARQSYLRALELDPNFKLAQQQLATLPVGAL